LYFNNTNDYLAVGLNDGVVKLWDLKLKEFTKQYKQSVHSSTNFITSTSFNNNTSMLAASNSKGFINMFPVAGNEG
jgi:WD40 repeat protein